MKTDVETDKPLDPSTSLQQPYGNLLELNTSRLILDSVGEDFLRQVINYFLVLLGSSSAIYEKNGDYAFGIFSSGWCRLLDRASRNLCDTSDNSEALACGKWLCHESCWATAKASMETGKPADMACAGGIRLYAAPIFLKNEVVGSINFGYGNPPRDPEKLRLLASQFGVKVEELLEQALAYEPRPPWVVDVAKFYVQTTASLIGQMLERKQAEKELQTAKEDIDFKNQIVNLFLTIPDDEIYGAILKLVLKVMDSRYGVFGYLDERGDLIIPTLTRDIWDECEIPGKDVVFPRDAWGDGTWCRAIREKRAFYSNEPSTRTPFGHIAIFKHIALPILCRDKRLGIVMVANRKTNYAARDVQVLSDIANFIAPILDARLQRDRMENSVRESEEKYRQFFAAESDAVMLVDVESRRFVDANDAALKLYQYGKEEFLRLRITDISEEPEQTEKAFAEMAVGRIDRISLRYHRKKDGTVIPVEIAAGTFMLRERKLLFAVVRDLTRHIAEERKLQSYAEALEKSNRMLEQEIAGHMGAESELKKYRVRLEALVEQRTAELKAAYQQLLHAEKLAAAGKLVASIAHEFSNPIFGIKNVLEQTIEEVPIDKTHQGLMEMALKECNRITTLIRGLQDFYRPTSGEMVPLEVNAVLDEVASLCRKQMVAKKIALEKRYAADLPRIKAVPDQIKQVFLNLLQNAEEAISGEGGKIAVATGYERSRVKISVQDTGSGISLENLQRIFDPFFTTKAEKGTGLGLSISREIVERHGGVMDVVSQIDEGTTFTVYLPVIEDLPVPKPG